MCASARHCAVFAVVLATAAAVSAAAATPTRVLDLEGRAVNPLHPPAGVVATVLVFTTTDCPVANRYAPEIKRLADRFRDRGVRFWLVYPVPGDTAAVVRTHLSTFAYGLPAVRDTALELVAASGVTVTPEVAVADAQGRFVYRGRIDDRYLDIGRDRLEPTAKDLEQALVASVSGQPVAVHETRAVGCVLADLVK